MGLVEWFPLSRRDALGDGGRRPDEGSYGAEAWIARA